MGLAKYIPPQIHEALFAGKVDKDYKPDEESNGFFSDITSLQLQRTCSLRFNKVSE